MKRIIVVCFTLLLFVGCTRQNVDDNAKSEVIDDLREQIEVLNEQYDEEINTLNEKIELLTVDNEELLQSVEEPITIVDAERKTQDVIERDNKHFKLYSAGTTYLEDGIIIILESYTDDMDMNWIYTWNRIDVGTLDTHSDIEVSDDKVYIVVNDELNVLDAITGNLIMSAKDVGMSGERPLIDSEGTVYVLGQFDPYVSAIDKFGNVLWQLNDEKLYGSQKGRINNGVIEFSTMNGDVKVNVDGEIISE